MKNIISEMKTTIERLNSKLDKAEGQISNMEDKVTVNTQEEKNKRKKN